MIGVHVSEHLRPFAQEFFELFKTPWEFYSSNRGYDAVICCGVERSSYDTPLLLIYSGTGTLNDCQELRGGKVGAAFFAYDRDRIPIYTSKSRSLDGSVTFEIGPGKTRSGDSMTTIRIDYNLFLEVAFLLNCGQPVNYASIPSVELHIHVLRDLLIQHTAYLIEVPSSPAGCSMIACLTHDVDHPSIRKQFWWPTLFGFLYRSTIGSVIEVCRGRKTLAQLATNLRATLSLPFIYAGLMKDIWDSFSAYSDLEKTWPSTYFFIPSKGHAGRDRKGIEHPKRAAAYAASEFSAAITALRSEGREIGVHGIDAWRDAKRGNEERQAISDLVGESNLGIRMHWLYYDDSAPLLLEEAGYDYDATVGYNGTVGFRAGTTQVFKPSKVSRLLELPLHIMDTALFYSAYLDLSSGQANAVISQAISKVQRFGGVLTINWHDRSLAPERLWGETYRQTIQQLSDAEAWFATCTDAVAWFRQRREISFDDVTIDSDNMLRITVRDKERQNNIPAARLRIHAGKGARFCEQGEATACFLEFEIREPSNNFSVPLRFSESMEKCR
jgi:hypothetical protein